MKGHESFGASSIPELYIAEHEAAYLMFAYAKLIMELALLCHLAKVA